MMSTITKEFAFSASHLLNGLPAGHPCGRLHGHNYIVRAEITGEVHPDTGFVIDYGELKPFGDWIAGNLDHHHLNDRFDGHNPTAEYLAGALTQELRWVLHQYFKGRYPHPLDIGVAVSETPKTWAIYREKW